MNRCYKYINIIIAMMIAVLLGVILFTENEYNEYYLVEPHQDIEISLEASEVEMIAKTVYGEARGLSTLDQSAVIWCILNRVDAGYGSITEVITAPNQFVGYRISNPVTDEFRALAEDILVRWKMESMCCGEVGRTLPKDYMWFVGRNGTNVFRNAWSGDYDVWDWSYYNPYE